MVSEDEMMCEDDLSEELSVEIICEEICRQ